MIEKAIEANRIGYASAHEHDSERHKFCTNFPDVYEVDELKL